MLSLKALVITCMVMMVTFIMELKCLPHSFIHCGVFVFLKTHSLRSNMLMVLSSVVNALDTLVKMFSKI
jgi:hypothetical protein